MKRRRVTPRPLPDSRTGPRVGRALGAVVADLVAAADLLDDPMNAYAPGECMTHISRAVVRAQWDAAQSAGYDTPTDVLYAAQARTSPRWVHLNLGHVLEVPASLAGGHR